MLLIVMSLVQLPSLVTREPVPAEPMTNVFEASCPGTRLRISGHGLARPEARHVRIELNGRVVAGPLAARMARDLSNMRAVYRLVGLCSRVGRSLQLQIWVGEAGGDGNVHYWAGTAGFLAGRLRAYDGLEPIDARAFWFR
jgi:hypothetical protein